MFPGHRTAFILVKQVLQATPGQNFETMAATFIVIADTVKAGSGAGRSGQLEVSPRYCPSQPTLGASCADCANIAGHKGAPLCGHSLYTGRGYCAGLCEQAPNNVVPQPTVLYGQACLRTVSLLRVLKQHIKDPLSRST